MKKLFIIACLFALVGGALTKHGKPDYLTITFKLNSGTKVQQGQVGGRDNRTTQVAEAKTTTKSTPTPTVSLVAVIQEDQTQMATKVKGVFTEAPEVAVAVFRAESGLRPQAQGWNCWYTNAFGQKYSSPCKPQDRPNAWSVDCGIAQLNFPGTTCPTEAFNVDWNLEQAKSKFERRGWQPWSAYNNGAYKQFLTWQ